MLWKTESNMFMDGRFKSQVVGGRDTNVQSPFCHPPHSLSSFPPKMVGETTLKPEAQVFQKVKQRYGKLCEASFYLRSKQIQNEPESSPCLPRARKRSRAFSFQLSVCLVLLAVFILFYLFYFILCLFRRKRIERINDPTSDVQKAVYALRILFVYI